MYFFVRLNCTRIQKPLWNTPNQDQKAKGCNGENSFEDHSAFFRKLAYANLMLFPDWVTTFPNKRYHFEKSEKFLVLFAVFDYN